MDRNYLLLTPGPLSTTSTVKEAMMRDWCTWDDDCKGIVQDIRGRLLSLAQADVDAYTAVLVQGSGTFGVEAALGTAVPKEGKLLVLENGAYGQRMEQIAGVLGIQHCTLNGTPDRVLDGERVKAVLEEDADITHVAFVHCETTTGILNALEEIVRVVKDQGRKVIVDAMSSFGGIPIAIGELDIDYFEQEGGAQRRCTRYADNQRTLVRLMEEAGFEAYLPVETQSPIITTFKYPLHIPFAFVGFYYFLKERGFVIYPGKLSDAEVFRIGTIGDVHKGDIERLCEAVSSYITSAQQGGIAI